MYPHSASQKLRRVAEKRIQKINMNRAIEIGKEASFAAFFLAFSLF